jgi:hypothetical protein
MPLNPKTLKVKGPFHGQFTDNSSRWWELCDESNRKTLGKNA